jgi:PH (Pleckstrin Homology) domain-containing protein
MIEFRKRIWLLPATIAVTAVLAIMLAILAREAVICASLGDWAAVRSYGLSALIPGMVLVFLWWGYTSIRMQRIDRQGVSALTLLSGRVALPWSAVRRARFERATALLEADTTRVRIGFTVYSDYKAAEAFARARLAEVGAQVDG